MKTQPAVAMTGNLRFTRSGVVWADYLLTGVDYHYSRLKDKTSARVAHMMLARALPGEALLLGLTADITPESVVARMTHEVDLDAHPAWVEECKATLATIGQFRPGRRVYWLSVPLTTAGFRGQMESAKEAAWLSLTDMLGIPHGAVPTEQIERASRAAARVAAAIPAMFDPVATTPAQAVWLWSHMVHRGLLVDPDLPDAGSTPAAKVGGALAAARLDEGALSDRPETGFKSKMPTMSAVLKVDTPWEADPLPSSYQVFSVIADTPSGGTRFPGSEIFSIADAAMLAGTPVDVDFAIRIQTKAGAEVLRQNQRALRNLNEQYHQREGELATGQSTLDVAAEALAEYTTLLESDRNEIEVAWAAVFAVSGPSAAIATEAAQALSKAYEHERFRVVIPQGYQEDLFWAMAPGVLAAKVKILKEFTQITTSSHFGAFVPVVGSRLGDDAGPLLALNISTTVPTPVHYDVSRLVERDVSNSFGCTGELGGGKTQTIMAILGAIIDRGGQALIIDQSTLGEYARWAGTIAGSVVVDMVNAKYSMDPLLVVGGQEGADQAEAILRSLLRVSSDHEWADTLSEVLSPQYRERHDYGGCGGLVAHLQSPECTHEHSTAIGKALARHSRYTYARALFGEGLPPLDITAPVIVFRTHDVSLPSREQMNTKHLYDAMAQEKQYGHVIYTHIAKLSRAIMYADDTRTSMLGCDEVAHLLSAADGLETITDVVKRGRKQNAGVALGDQDCDFGSDELRGLLKTRIAHRHTDTRLARKALEWLEMDPTNDALLVEYTKHTSPIDGKSGYVRKERRGEGYMRDAAGRFGRIKILTSALQSRSAAASTTPGAAPSTVAVSTVKRNPAA